MRSAKNFPLKALSEKIRRANEKRAAVALETRFEIAGKRVKAVVVEIVVVTGVKGCTRTRIQTEQKLSADVRRDRIVIDPRSDERESRKLICRAQSDDIRLESRTPVVVTAQTAFRVIE